MKQPRSLTVESKSAGRHTAHRQQTGGQTGSSQCNSRLRQRARAGCCQHQIDSNYKAILQQSRSSHGHSQWRQRARADTQQTDSISTVKGRRQVALPLTVETKSAGRLLPTANRQQLQNSQPTANRQQAQPLTVETKSAGRHTANMQQTDSNQAASSRQTAATHGETKSAGRLWPAPN
jgi:hypothetical protein